MRYVDLLYTVEAVTTEAAQRGKGSTKQSGHGFCSNQRDIAQVDIHSGADDLYRFCSAVFLDLQVIAGVVRQALEPEIAEIVGGDPKLFTASGVGQGADSSDNYLLLLWVINGAGNEALHDV